eukprot:CAMPEP_0178428882 /NCGR_PEP_ID=MMETSP0689_2-20121128/30513_1 /TAXON_ID=160604 /ORGANISM="Amphidinium massartii, Strain CS-259" /LENGTH=83 /DNA_ID=CAMNT_0020050681 /DNA_START=141 /DNA_END=392 /DNA_ORIENTATION=+
MACHAEGPLGLLFPLALLGLLCGRGCTTSAALGDVRCTWLPVNSDVCELPREAGLCAPDLLPNPEAPPLNEADVPKGAALLAE